MESIVIKDFDFLAGTWRTHYKILRHRLSGDNEWDECHGTATVMPFWDGGGNLEDGEFTCPPPRGHVRSVTLRLFDAATRRWSLYWGTTKVGLATPPQVGSFDDQGVGDFLAPDTIDGKPIIVRYRWTLLPGDHPHFEQAFSSDGGNTWETNWICDYTRTST